jgi:hypothetical protein
VPCALSTRNRTRRASPGDYGLGFAANSLALGCDCAGEVTYFDGVVNDSAGQPVVIKNAVCLHEEDAGLLWKHLDYRCGRSAGCVCAHGRCCGHSACVTRRTTAQCAATHVHASHVSQDGLR